jgi:hypothetical protein
VLTKQSPPPSYEAMACSATVRKCARAVSSTAIDQWIRLLGGGLMLYLGAEGMWPEPLRSP